MEKKYERKKRRKDRLERLNCNLLYNPIKQEIKKIKTQEKVNGKDTIKSKLTYLPLRYTTFLTKVG